MNPKRAMGVSQANKINHLLLEEKYLNIYNC